MQLSAKKIFRWFLLAVICLTVLGGATFLIWRVQLANDINRRLAAIRAAGLPANGAELNAYYPAVPDSENAALVMTQAFALACNFHDSRSNEVSRFKMPARNVPLTDEQRKLLADYVTLNADALAKAQEAIKLPRSRYPVDYTALYNTPLPYLAKLKGLAQAAREKAALASEAGRFEEASTLIANILGMAETLDDDPILISQLVRVAMVQIATMSLERCLNDGTIPENCLRDLGKSFSAAENNELMARAFIGERATGIPLFRMSRAEIERLSKSAEQGDEVTAGPPLPGRPPFFLMLTGFFERDLRFFLQTMETNIALAKLPPPQCLQSKAEFERAGDIAKKRFYIFSGLLLPALSKTVVKEARSTAYLRLAVTAAVVERFRIAHGQLPDSLNALVPQYLDAVPADPFDGSPLRFRHLEKGFVVYSIGDDGKDDGGREKPADWKSTDKSTYDFTFTVER